ncbi:serine hydrolase [Candidatus Bathyarchaeota archaeon]|nr:serine hydrolase [Candidatus Bathyarchaeota archaeon]
MIPAGSLFSSAREMAKFVIFHLKGSESEGKKLINKSTLEKMYEPQFPSKNQLVGHGLGILRGYDSDVLLLHNSGGGYGYATYHIWLPKYGIGVVVLTNQNNHSIHQSIAYDAIEKMLKLKHGYVRKVKPLIKNDIAEKPVFNTKVKTLHRFEGDYWADYGLMQISELNGILHRTLVNGKEETLTPISETDFINGEGHIFTFKIDESGKPVGLTIFRDVYGTSYCPLHFSPYDVGPDNENWRKYTGIYSTQMQGNIIYYSIMMKSGYLYMFREGILHEYEPNFFFTSEGEAVTFRDNKMNYANIPLVKEINQYEKLLKLKETNPEDKMLRKYSLQNLSDAYKLIGDIENMTKINELNQKLHPELNN